MSRFITVRLESRGVECTARLLDEEAPRTANAVWDALPLSGQVFHGKYARNEIYHLVESFAAVEPGKENTTITPIPGDLCYFAFDSDDLGNPAYGYEEGDEHTRLTQIVDLALFYGRNNLLINGTRAGCRATCSAPWCPAWRRWPPPARTSGWAAPAGRP